MPHVVDIGGYGDFDARYREVLMVGDVSPSVVMNSFRTPDTTKVSASTVTVPKSEHHRKVLELLVKHFKSHGYKPMTTHEVTVGD